MFRDFLAWIVSANKDFLVIGNKNCITYKEVFPLIKDNKLWIGPSITSGDREFMVPKDYVTRSPSLRIDENGNKYIRVPGVHWFTNLEHGRRHEPLRLMTMKDNLRYSKHKDIRENGYSEYDNYDALDVPYTDAIPSDYDGKMGVPITFLDKYCPEQFEIVGNGDDVEWLRLIGAGVIGKNNIDKLRKQGNKAHVTANMTSLCMTINGEVFLPYKRIIIRKKQ